jgi:HEAT repeat protein
MLLLAGATLFTAMPAPHAAGARAQNPSDRATVAVKGLWSSSEEQRQAAKRKIIELGEEAAQPLVLLLQDLARNPSPRFPTGREQEGTLAVERASRQLSSNDVTEIESQQGLFGIVINSRLTQDAIELLGLIRAKEAIPVLIEAMEAQETVGGATLRMRPEMAALVMIGTEAVLPLIEEIDNLSKHPRLGRPPTGRFVLPDAASDGRDREEPLAALADRLEKSGVSPEEIEAQTLTIQVRAAIVLGRIGDSRALPTLEQLRARTTKPWATASLDQAIDSIRAKTQRKTSNLGVIDLSPTSTRCTLALSGPTNWPTPKPPPTSRLASLIRTWEQDSIL